MSLHGGVDAEDAFVQHVKHIHGRYLVEIVERFELCPWAAGARRSGATEAAVVTERNPSPEGVAQVAITLMTGRGGTKANAGRVALGSETTARRGTFAGGSEASSPGLSVGFVLVPRFAGLREAFERFATRVRRQLATQQPQSARLAVAPFHPAVKADLRSPATLVPYLRRSPYPTLQLIPTRILESLESAERSNFLQPWMLSPAGMNQGSAEPLRDRVHKQIHGALRTHGVEAMEKVFDELLSHTNADPVATDC